MTEKKKKIPNYFKSTVDMIESAYSSGFLEDDYFPLIKIMKSSGMSDRSVAEVLSILLGGKYINYLYDVAHLTPNKNIDAETISNIIHKLKGFGYDEWLAED